MSLIWRPVEYAHRSFTMKCAGPNCSVQRIVQARCGRRTCPECRTRDYYRLRRKYGSALNNFRRPKLLTLTLPNTPELTRKTIQRLRDSMRALWMRLCHRVQGGFYGIEPIPKGRGWHVHVPVIVSAAYLPQAELSTLWPGITGDAFWVPIRRTFSP